MDRDISEFYHGYDVHEEIGQGKFGVVRRCTLRSDKQSFALKILKETEHSKKPPRNEIEILLQLKHRHIVRMHDYYTDSNKVFIVLEYLSGGDLFDELTKRSFYSERDASICIQQILAAVEHCHYRGIIHRDLKPENLLLAPAHGILIKLVDFGIAVRQDRDTKFWYGFAGTLGYLSPEVINREGYGKGVDIWACGVILYILLCGYPPFHNDDQRELFGSITNGRYEFHSPEWDTVTSKARDIVRSMLTVNQDNRPAASDLLTHPWIRERNDTASTENREEAIGALRRFTAKCKLKTTVNSIMAINRGSVDKGVGHRFNSSKQINQLQNSPNESVRLSVDSTTAVTKRIYDLTCKLISSESIENLVCDKTTEFRAGVPCIITSKDRPVSGPVSSTQTHKHTILNPIFHILSPDAVCIAYIHVCTLHSDTCTLHANVRSSKETRIWQKLGADWMCLHCHSSEI